jgi:hypothetical protein
MLPERITHTHTLEEIKEYYNARMEEEWCMSNACDF